MQPEAALAEAPTIDERVALGMKANSTEDGAIVPFPVHWDPQTLLHTFAPGRGALVFKLHEEGYRVTSLYPYHDSTGRTIFAAVRMDHPNKRKQVLPLRASRAIGINPNLEVKAIDAPRPLYGLDLLAVSPDAPVLIVEGEKAADAGRLLFDDYIVVTWPGGAPGIKQTDWRPLIGRKVTIWPDHDVTGRDAAESLGSMLTDLGVASLSVVQVPAHFPKKWDLADPIPELTDAN